MTTSSFSSPENVVSLWGVPRSGTSWLGQILNSSPEVAYRYQPLFSYEFNNRLNENSNREDIEKFHIDLVNAESDFVLQLHTVSGQSGEVFYKDPEPKFLAWKEVRYINILENFIKNSDAKALLLARHPGAVLNSWIRAPKEFDKSWNPLEEWMYAEKKNLSKPENYYGYRKWEEAMQAFVKTADKYSDRVMLVKYEDLNDTPFEVVGDIFNFLGLEMKMQTRDFLRASTAQNDDDPYGVRRSQQDSNKWLTELNEGVKSELEEQLCKSDIAKKLGYISLSTQDRNE